MSEKEPGIIAYFLAKDVVDDNFRRADEVAKKDRGNTDLLLLELSPKAFIKSLALRAELAVTLPLTITSRILPVASTLDFLGNMEGNIKDPFTGLELAPHLHGCEYIARASLSASRFFGSLSLCTGAAAVGMAYQKEYLLSSVFATGSVVMAILSRKLENTYLSCRQLLLDSTWFEESALRDRDNFEFASDIHEGLDKKPYPNFIVRQVMNGRRDINDLPVYIKGDRGQNISLVNQQVFVDKHRNQEMLCEVLRNSPCKKENCPFYQHPGTYSFLDPKIPLCREFKISFTR